MEGLPAEIYGLIFSEACTDDGYTGRSLALVSKTIRAASSPHVLQSIALYGSHQLSAFAKLLEHRAPEDCRIRHLFLTDRRRVWMEYAPGQDRSQWVDKRMKEELHINDPMRRYSSDAIVQIVRTAAPSLRTLAFLLFDLYDENTLPAAFPALRELTLHASSLMWRGVPSLAPCPALRRLHVIQDYSFPSAAVKTISGLAPHLTHLRISRLTGSRIASGDILDGLERMLEEQTDEPAADPPPPTLPPSLERVFVQMAQQALYDDNGALQLLTSPHAYELRDIALRDTRQRIVMLRPALWDTAAFGRYETDIEYYMGVKSGWEGRLVGEEGAWALDPEDVLAMNGMDDSEE